MNVPASQHPWLRINLVLRQMVGAYRNREARVALKLEVAKANRTPGVA